MGKRTPAWFEGLSAFGRGYFECDDPQFEAVLVLVLVHGHSFAAAAARVGWSVDRAKRECRLVFDGLVESLKKIGRTPRCFVEHRDGEEGRDIAARWEMLRTTDWDLIE